MLTIHSARQVMTGIGAWIKCLRSNLASYLKRDASFTKRLQSKLVSYSKRNFSLKIRRVCAGYLSIAAEALMSNRDKKPENDSSDFVSQGKIISILMPSRGRPESLRDALRNITETCNDPNLVEILIRLDDDDTETLEIKDSLVKECVPINLRIIVGPRGGGYKTFHVLINELAASAKGDFLFLFNDDARIKTERWDQLILKERERMSIIQTRTPIPEGSNMFPIVHRKIVQILGHFSLNPHCDTWMKLLSEECGIRVDIEAIAIAHIRGQMKDTTYAETSSAYKTTSSSFFSPETTRIRHADTARILRYLVRCGRRLNIR